MAHQPKTKSGPKHLSERVIRDYVDPRSFSKGQDYHRQDMIFDERVEGGTLLKARCEGSSGGPYRVWAEVSGGRILEAECTCPVGAFCKHIVALLLAWKEHPETFIEVEGLDEVLQSKSKAELVALVKQLIAREPDLEPLVERPISRAKGGKRSKELVTAETYERQAAAVFRRNRPDWDEYDEYGDSGSGSQCVEELQPILVVGDEFIDKKDFVSASAVFEGVLNAFIEHYEEEYQNEEGTLDAVVDHCVDQLGRCLDGLKDDRMRREVILRALYEIERFDTEGGGLDLSIDPRAILIEKTTPQERALVAGWVRAAVKETRKAPTHWRGEHRLRAYGELLLTLEVDTLDDEGFLKICRETGRMIDLIRRLLERKRIDEATKEARTLSDHDLLQAAAVFLHHKQAKLIEDLIRERAEKSQDDRILEWLRDRAAKRNDWSAALEWAQAIFRKRYGFSDYTTIRTIARRLKRWDALRPELMAFLASKHQTALIVDIHLDEGEIDEALERIKGIRESAYDGEWLRLKVAKAAEKSRPQAAREIYLQHAVRLIERQGRHQYQDACRYLKKVRELDDSAAWAKEASRLREKYNRFPAFLDEMNKAKL